MVGKKSSNQGYVYAPYIISTTTTVISESAFNPILGIKSRYSRNFYGRFRNETRKTKIENIFKIIF